ncbi:MAG: hypothetical protein ACHQUC_02175 [Chlamydiales bacterium]
MSAVCVGPFSPSSSSFPNPATRRANLGIGIFDGVEIPPATSDKYIFCFLIHNVPDGIGDFLHAIDFLEKCSPIIQEKGYKVYALVTAYIDDSSTSAISKRGLFVQERLKTAHSYHHLCFVANEDLYESAFSPKIPAKYQDSLYWWAQTHSEELASIRNHTAGVVEVSVKSPSFVIDNFQKDVVITRCHQYGSDSNNKLVASDPFSNSPYYKICSVPMGGLNPLRKDAYGIKIIKSSSHLSRVERLLALQSLAPEFLCALLDTDLPNETAASAYYTNHRFMPGYLQSYKAASAFITTQVIRYLDQIMQGLICDFHLPYNAIDQNEIINLLSHFGILADQVAFIHTLPPSSSSDKDIKIRIFTCRIESYEAYNALYQISGDGAAASGDNSISLAFSGDHIPWYQMKCVKPICSFYTNELPKLINYLKLSLTENSKGNEELIDGLQELFNYFDTLNTFVKVVGDINEITKSRYNYYKLHPNYKNSSLTDPKKIATFLEFCKSLANHLKNPNTQLGWQHIREYLQTKDYYAHIPNILKSTLILSSQSNSEIVEYVRNADQIQTLIENGQLDPSKLHQYDYRFLEFISDDRVFQLILDYGVSVEALHTLFPEPPFPEWRYLYYGFISCSFTESHPGVENQGENLKNNIEKIKRLNRSPLIIMCKLIFTNIIQLDPDDLESIPEDRWWSTIVSNIRYSDVYITPWLKIAANDFYLKGNKAFLNFMLPFVFKLEENLSERILRDFLQKMDNHIEISNLIERTKMQSCIREK